MELKVIAGDFSVCKLPDYSGVNLDAPFCFTGKTDAERSIVCLTGNAPQNATDREDGFKAFRIEGVLDFSLIGILSRISTLLAQNQIGIFVISTYNTDYVLIKEERFSKALQILETAGYTVLP